MLKVEANLYPGKETNMKVYTFSENSV